MPRSETVAIAGAGRIAQALGHLLRERGEPVVAVAGTRTETARQAAEFIGGEVEPVSLSALPACASRILIAVPDHAIAGVAEVLARSGMENGTALHTCGAYGEEALAPLAAKPVSCGTLHPLQTVASPEQGVWDLPGAAFAVSGSGDARAWAEHIVTLLNGRALWISAEQRPLYHAAAVMASNYVVGMIDAAVILMCAAGVREDEALSAVAPLVRASAGNALTSGPASALTGPIERGDGATVSRHWRALAGAPDSVRQLYRAAGLHVLELARRSGLPDAKALELEELLRKSDEPNG